MTDWFDLSLAGDLDNCHREQYGSALDARMNLLPSIKEDLEDFLPDKRVPAPPCPGFDRLDAIMSIPMDEPENDLATYKPTWSSGWAAAMSGLSEEIS